MTGAGRHRFASYLLFGGLLILILLLRQGAAVLGGLFSYAAINLTYRALSRRMRPFPARWSALAVFVVVAVLACWQLGWFLRQSLSTVPLILANILPAVERTAAEYRLELPFENLEELRRLAIDSLRENAGDVTHASGLLTKGVFHLLLSVVAAVLAFMAGPQDLDRRTLYGALRAEFDERARLFLSSFERVLGAQVAISAINTAATAVFLLLMGFPHFHFLVPATFLLGVLPVIGNIFSNTLICLTALTLSARHSAFALVFLVAIHKAEYFLNSRIIGSSIRTPMWQTLLGILLGEVILGLPGIILAPALLHYVRRELEALPATAA